MFLLDSTSDGAPRDLVFSASDLVTASECEYRLLRVLDEKLGRCPRADFARDEMLARASVLGDLHEHRVLDAFVAEFGPWDPGSGTGVYDVEPAGSMDRGTLVAKHSESIGALESGADVVFQAAFFDGTFHGRSDFLVKQADGTHAVFDTKLARHAKVSALLQLAAYGDQLIAAGIRPNPVMTLVLGNGTHSNHSLTDVLPAFRERRRRLLDITAAHRAQDASVRWGDPRFTACGRCDYCAEQVKASRDVLLVAGMSLSRRRRLNDAGIATIDQLARMDPGTDAALKRLAEQARFQIGADAADGSVSYPDKNGDRQTMSYKVLPANTLGMLPDPSEGDIFFDFEGDPLWQDPITGSWGIEYLFGVAENAPVPGGKPPFKPLWAHDKAQEKQALVDFLAYVEARRSRYPDLHIYHYAAYEKSALRRLSLTHVIGEAAVDNLLRDGVLVDLYATVRHSIRISENSYSIKKLEPLYMGTNLRSGDVTDAGASVVAYANYCEARDAGNQAEAAVILAGIADYNEYDCLSTLELRNWLLELRAGHPELSAPPPVRDPGTEAPDREPYQTLPEEQRLLDYGAALRPDQRLEADNQAIAMVGAAVGYHRREEKQFWWGHFDRLSADVDSWADTRDVFVVQHAEVLADWERPTPRSNPARTLRLSGRLAEGSTYKPGQKLFRMYADPLTDGIEPSPDPTVLRSGWFGTEVLEVDRSGELDVVVVTERLRRGMDEFRQYPMALTPEKPVPTPGQREALSRLASQVGAALPTLPANPALDLLRRSAPRLAGLDALPAVGSGADAYIEAITAAVTALDRSYLAVQGPPGTGKTHVGSHVIANLVARGWKVGVAG
ncbi:MAG: TM0106 family RecB-like putative nuclease, partial [Actinomycetales bacterium]